MNDTQIIIWAMIAIVLVISAVPWIIWGDDPPWLRDAELRRKREGQRDQ